MDEPTTQRPNWRTKALVALAVCILLLIALWQVACNHLLPGLRLGGATPTGVPGSLTVYYTCDTSGQMEPCRCSSGQTGGMSRRIGWLKSQKDVPALLVDAGDVTGGDQDWERLEFDYILQGYAAAGYHAVNAGHKELTLGANRLRELGKGKVPFVSANVFDDQGAPIFPPYRIVTLPGGVRAAVIGIVDTDFNPARLGPGLQVGPPAEALAKWLPELKAKADVTVLLAFAGETAIQEIAEKFDGIDVIVGGNTFRPTGEPLTFGKSVVVLITDKGKAIGRLRLAPAEAGDASAIGRWTAQNEIVKLTQDLPSDKAFGKLYEDYKRRLIALDFKPTPASAAGLTSGTLPRSAQADHYVGAAQCKECHEAAWKAWTASVHSHAFASLEAQNNHYNPRCVPCHTVGYGASDGYVNPTATAQLQNVQCETCHGRGEHHIKISRGEPVAARRAVLRKVDCTVCHNIERSPGFDYDTAWPKIAH